MNQYLYGAAVQGIQSFIFQTNKLKEIVRASELVEQICTELFRSMVGNTFSKEALIIGAAGNIKYIFSSRVECERIVREFPKRVMEFAPGITLSQAVVSFDGELCNNHIQQLEQRLKAQRNRPTPSLHRCLMAMERSRRTGGAGVVYRDNEVIDVATACKLDNTQAATHNLLKKILPDSSIRLSDIPFDLKGLVGRDEEKSYIAVIHADGNGLGAILQQLGKSVEVSHPTLVKEAFRNFSIALDTATTEAAKRAFERTYEGDIDKLLLRPVILGGDDLTVICDAKHALRFTHFFLAYFEEETKKEFKHRLGKFNLQQTHLTACAGVAFVKANYPFHYAIHLAEQLCGETKRVAKERAKENQLAASSYLFHKVQGSYIESYEAIKERELTASGVSLTKGPLFISAAFNL